MPQRQFWTEQHPCEVRWVYRHDPTNVEGDSTLQCVIYDQAGKVMEARAVSVPPKVVHEAVSCLLSESWEGWLFGEPGAATDALRSCALRWRQYARDHALV